MNKQQIINNNQQADGTTKSHQVGKQRDLYQKGKLKQDWIMQLESYGAVWNVKDDKNNYVSFNWNVFYQ